MSPTPVSESQHLSIWALSFYQKLYYQHPFKIQNSHNQIQFPICSLLFNYGE